MIRRVEDKVPGEEIDLVINSYLEGLIRRDPQERYTIQTVIAEIKLNPMKYSKDLAQFYSDALASSLAKEVSSELSA